MFEIPGSEVDFKTTSEVKEDVEFKGGRETERKKKKKTRHNARKIKNNIDVFQPHKLDEDQCGVCGGETVAEVCATGD